jgi:hypothetical protein
MTSFALETEAKAKTHRCGDELAASFRFLDGALGGWWHARNAMYARGSTLAAWLPGHHLALGGGGLAHWLVRLFIWHEIFRLIRFLWRIPTFGPFIVIAIGLVIVGLAIWRRYHGPIWGRRRGGSTGYGTGSGPRDW